MSMPSAELERLVSIHLLSHEPPIRAEIEGLLATAEATLTDARSEALSPESRFQLAYGAVHSIALAALRWHGYRPRNRQIVFQALAHTLQVPAPVWKMLARSHEQRNRREYEGGGEIDDRLLADVIAAGSDLLARMHQLRLPGEAT
jgi:hypothetical protein